MRRNPGVVIGVVKSLDDPAGEGRIQVEFPWLADGQRSGWAPIAVPMAGGRRGMFFMPEVEDEVLVAFEQGDFDHPFIVGFLWNGVDRPPDDGIDSSVRRLRTVSGHVLEFDDRAARERIYLKTQAGHEIEMKDAPPSEASVTIKTAGGNQIELTDVPPGITVSTSTGVTISATTNGINISAPTGMITADCVHATINARALLNVNAAMSIFNGIIKSEALITQSVVSPAYTPGVGNVFGL